MARLYLLASLRQPFQLGLRGHPAGVRLPASAITGLWICIAPVFLEITIRFPAGSYKIHAAKLTTARFQRGVGLVVPG